MCFWCAFSGRFVRACARFVWVSFSSFVCRSSWSFFVCVRDSEVFVSYFEFEFSCRILNSYFEFDSRIRFLEFSKSCFEVAFRIRLFRFVALFDFSNFVALFDFSNFDFRFEFRFSIRICRRICRRNFRCLALFDFSNVVEPFDFSNFVAQFDFSNFEFSIRIFDSSALNFEFVFFVVLIYSTSRISICESNLMIWISHWTLQFSFSCLVLKPRFESWYSLNFLELLLSTDVHHYSRTQAHVCSRVATRALRALFVRKILVKRQFTCSLYFSIIEL